MEQQKSHPNLETIMTSGAERTFDPRRYRAAIGVAIVSGVFALIVCGFMIANHLRSRAMDPINPVELAMLKAELVEKGQDEALTQRIRETDLALRHEYFRRRTFTERGSYLLLAGVALFLISVKLAYSYRRQPPMPPEEGNHARAEERTTRIARWSVGGLGVSLIIGSLLLAFLSKEALTRESLSGGGNAGYPSDEEIAENWPRFRGPDGLGIAHHTNVPTEWDGATGAGIRWKIEIPLPGENSPIVWEDRVFLTGATEEERAVYCVDANTGQMLWETPIEGIAGSPTEAPEVMEETGFAAPTAVTDGRHVAAIFGNGDLACLDFDGAILWAKNLGLPDNMYGHASSLAMHKGRLLVLFDQGSADDGLSSLMALDMISGNTIWQTVRPVPNSWATPIVIDAGDREEIITCAAPWVMAYSPDSGEELWRAECLDGDVAPSPVYADGLVFATNDYSYVAAIRPGGSGDVTETHIAWTAEDNLPDICSPLTNGELLFLLTSYGLLTCYDGKTGEIVWEHDLDEMFQASPTLVGDRIYIPSEEGTMFIVAASREYAEQAKTHLDEPIHASPAFMDGRIYIRGTQHLYCIE